MTGEWSAPVDRWVRRATDRDDRILGAAARLLLDDMWSRADAPSKRDPGPAFVWGAWVEFAEMAREFQCADRTIRTQFSQLRDAGLARRGRSVNDQGRLVDGIWLADVPATGRFDADQNVRTTGSDDPPARIKTSAGPDQNVRDCDGDRIKPSDGADQTVRLDGSNDPVKRIKPSDPIRKTRSDPIKTRSIPEQDPRESTTAADSTPIAPPTPEARPPQADDDPTSTECDTGATGSTVQMFALDSPTKPPTKRDLAAEVFDHLRDRVIATKRDLGIKPATGPRKLQPKDRKSIEARIADYGHGDHAVEMCKRVIAIDEAECRAQGAGGQGWGYWNASTPFRPGNFDQRLGRWREDGKHALMTRTQTNGQQRRGPNVSGYDLHKEFPCDGT